MHAGRVNNNVHEILYAARLGGNPYTLVDTIIAGLQERQQNGAESWRARAREYIDKHGGAPLNSLVERLTELGPAAESLLRYAEAQHPHGWVGDAIRGAVATVRDPVALKAFRERVKHDDEIGYKYDAAERATAALMRGDADAYATLHHIMEGGGAPMSHAVKCLKSLGIARPESALWLLGFGAALHEGTWFGTEAASVHAALAA